MGTLAVAAAVSLTLGVAACSTAGTATQPTQTVTVTTTPEAIAVAESAPNAEPTHIPRTRSAPGPATFDLVGRIRLDSRGNGASIAFMVVPKPKSQPNACEGANKYRHFRTGARITVRDSSGAIVALGKLGQAVSNTAWGEGVNCVIPLKISDVPKDSRFYTLQVRGGPEEIFSRKEVLSGLEVLIRN